ncbi:hypothetical protein TrLO_g8815 [Triparma laevis f. longispina]|uniref:GH16 domain-containing protein n=1 Tax=Triparma laevis f. longispina TaxID=1714387 RepID=A0A9W7E4L2_9STRA|nr:hypothetical protein TrLO_g8815 [Triparma laevis f. longispina]
MPSRNNEITPLLSSDGPSSPHDFTSDSDYRTDPDVPPSSSTPTSQAPRDTLYHVLITILVLSSFTAGVVLAVKSGGLRRGRFTGEYVLQSYQTSENMLDDYEFYIGKDSAGSGGYVTYVSKSDGFDLNIIGTSPSGSLYLGSSLLNSSRTSIRLEGRTRYSNGLFLLKLEHAPTGCGVWPAWWLTDEGNWPEDGEIDIFESVNKQSKAKTALHTTEGCEMKDAPRGEFTGEWDTAVGIPDKKTGVPKETGKLATNCYVYDPDQWLNQGCVVESDTEGTIGTGFNDAGGGMYALEWDPGYGRIRTWAWKEEDIPTEVLDSYNGGEDVNTDDWGLPYGHFPIGEDSDCEASHFRNMRVVFNMAFCGTVAGNRFGLDCPKEKEKYGTCEKYVSEDENVEEAYWLIEGMRVWQRKFVEHN